MEKPYQINSIEVILKIDELLIQLLENFSHQDWEKQTIDQIPEDNFYKVLKGKLDLRFVYKSTESVYCHTGRASLDPVVFFKLLLVGYFENICSDRALERLFQLRLDLLYFIDHDLGEPIPDHSTICKARKRIPKKVFEDVF